MSRKKSKLLIPLTFIFSLSKRQTFVLSAFILSLGFIIIQVVDTQWRYVGVFVLTFLAFILSLFSLREDLDGIEWITLPILPTLYTMSVVLFYFLLPTRLLTRFPIVFLFGFGYYALLLTENIYNVAIIRTIALLRAAHTVGFLLTIATVFFLFNTLLTFHFHSFIQGSLVFLVSFPLLFQALWSIILPDKIEKRLIYYSLGLSLLIGEIAFLLAFWPVTGLVGSIFLSSAFYVLLGMGQRHFDQRLFKKEIYEFIIVGTSMFLLMFFATKWGG